MPQERVYVAVQCSLDMTAKRTEMAENTEGPGERRLRLAATGEELVDLEVLVTEKQFQALVEVAKSNGDKTLTDVVRRYIAEGLARESPPG